MATLLVIGGSGFFGKSILDSFSRDGLKEWGVTKIIAASRNPDKLLQECPELITSNVELVTLDVSKPHVLPEADYIIHAAASTDAAQYLDNGEVEKQNIISGVNFFCDALKLIQNSPKVIFCSSGAVYGQQKGIRGLSENDIFTLSDELDVTKQLYCEGKREAEKIIIKFNGNHSEVAIKIARCFAFYGDYLPQNKHFAFGNFLSDAKLGNNINVLATKKVYRSYMHADDLVKSLLLIMNAGEIIYNVGSDMFYELTEIAHIIAKKYNVSVNIHHYDRNGEDRYYPNIDKLRKILGEIKLSKDFKL
jgi:nucleoside-diphosphate-sugar epimerase